MTNWNLNPRLPDSYISPEEVVAESLEFGNNFLPVEFDPWREQVHKRLVAVLLGRTENATNAWIWRQNRLAEQRGEREPFTISGTGFYLLAEVWPHATADGLRTFLRWYVRNLGERGLSAYARRFELLLNRPDLVRRYWEPENRVPTLAEALGQSDTYTESKSTGEKNNA